MAARLAKVTGADIILYDYPGRGGTTLPPTIEAAAAFGPADAAGYPDRASGCPGREAETRTTRAKMWRQLNN
jgi:hypothetical protein